MAAGNRRVGDMTEHESNDMAPGGDPAAGAPGTTPPGDGRAEALRGFGPLGIVAFVLILLGNAVVVPLSAVLVLLWVRLSRTPWRAIGYVRPRSWAVTVVGGIVFGGAFKLAMKSLVMPLLGADPVNHTFHYLSGNRAALPFAIYLMVAGAGFGEETLWRGFLFERFGRWLGVGTVALTVTVLVTSVLFALAHYSQQGLTGVEQALITGLVFGTIRAGTSRIPLLIVAHAAFDLTALYLIYRDLETPVAHWFFR